MDVSDKFFIFFCSSAGDREEVSEEVARGSVLIENTGKAGGYARGRRWGGMSVGGGGG